jgi:hypothetical protein
VRFQWIVRSARRNTSLWLARPAELYSAEIPNHRSRQDVRWAHRLKVYVPTQTRAERPINLLAHFVVELTGKEPAHTEHIDRRVKGSVPEAVLALAKFSRTMIHRNLQ